MHGFDPSGPQVPFEDFFATIQPEDLQGVKDALEKAIRTRTDYDIEYRICRADNGNIRFFVLWDITIRPEKSATMSEPR